jgi:hypothetical protein
MARLVCCFRRQDTREVRGVTSVLTMAIVVRRTQVSKRVGRRASHERVWIKVERILQVAPGWPWLSIQKLENRLRRAF